jgi:hypothetical protein
VGREASADYIVASAAGHVDEVVFAEFRFASGTARVCSREHDIEWDGQVWAGAGRVGSIKELEEAGTIEPFGLEMALLVTDELLALALNPAEYKNRDVLLWRGLLDFSDPAGRAVVADPVGPFTYRMDLLEFELGETSAIRLTAESRLADWQRPRVRYNNDADQQAQYPGDEFFKDTESFVERVLLW